MIRHPATFILLELIYLFQALDISSFEHWFNLV